MNDEEFEEMNREALSTTKMMAWAIVMGISVIVGGILIIIYYAVNH